MIPTKLTAQGHEVFSNYAAGTAFDPIDLTIDAATDCGSATAVGPATTNAQVANGTSGNAWWFGGGAVVLLGIAAAVLAVRSRRSVPE